MLLAILVIAQLDFVIGSVIGPTDDTEKAKGFAGYSSKLFLSLTSFNLKLILQLIFPSKIIQRKFLARL